MAFDENMIYGYWSRAKRKRRGKPYRKIRSDQHRESHHEYDEYTEGSNSVGPPEYAWASGSESERGSPIAESSDSEPDGEKYTAQYSDRETLLPTST